MAKQDKQDNVGKFAVVVLDETGSMRGQEERVCSSMNEYAGGLPEGTRLSVFKFDSNHWTKFFSGKVKKWKQMTQKDYTPSAMTPLYDAIAKAIAHAKKISTKKDRVMIMIDTDGEENASKEHKFDSIKALVKDCKDNLGWEFLFMSGGLSKREAVGVSAQGQALGMSTQSASHAVRAVSYGQARLQTADYLNTGASTRSITLDDDGTEDNSPQPAVQPQSVQDLMKKAAAAAVPDDEDSEPFYASM